MFTKITTMETIPTTQQGTPWAHRFDRSRDTLSPYDLLVIPEVSMGRSGVGWCRIAWGPRRWDAMDITSIDSIATQWDIYIYIFIQLYIYVLLGTQWDFHIT
jgi:hypothetical protein